MRSPECSKSLQLGRLGGMDYASEGGAGGSGASMWVSDSHLNGNSAHHNTAELT